MTLSSALGRARLRVSTASPGAAAAPRRALTAPVAALVIVLGLGVFARFDRLAWHFTSADDLLPMTQLYGAEARHEWQPYRYAKEVATHSTYAPLQYLLYPLLLSPDTGYRTMLLLGRLPSALLSALAILLTAIALWRAKGRCDWGVVLGAGVSAFSLLSIVYAHQMSPYAFGLFGAATLVLMLHWALETGSPHRRHLLALVAGILPYASYQLILLSGVALASCALCDIRSQHMAVRWRTVVSSWLVTACVFVAVVAPITLKFILGMRARANFGWQGAEQFFPFYDPSASSLTLVWDTVSYLANCYYHALANQLANVDPATPALALWMGPVLALGGWGAIQCLRSSQPARFGVGFFVVGTLALWGVLNLAGRLPLSPTRHTLVFLPLLAFAIGIGVSEFSACARRAGEGIAAMLSAIAFCAFAYNYSEFQAARQDPFDPKRLSALVEETRADAIVEYAWTVQHSLMFRNGGPAPVITMPRGWELERLDRLDPSPARVLFVSYFTGLHEFTHKGHSLYEALLARGYRIQTLIEHRSTTPIETSRLLFNGTNSQYIYLATLAEVAASTAPSAAPGLVPSAARESRR